MSSLGNVYVLHDFCDVALRILVVIICIHVHDMLWRCIIIQTYDNSFVPTITRRSMTTKMYNFRWHFVFICCWMSTTTLSIELWLCYQLQVIEIWTLCWVLCHSWRVVLWLVRRSHVSGRCVKRWSESCERKTDRCRTCCSNIKRYSMWWRNWACWPEGMIATRNFFSRKGKTDKIDF